MLDRLDDIDWNSLDDAYGTAEGVPDLLRSLISADKGERDEALNELFGCVWHQGTIYSCTSHVVPFLVELLEKDAAPDREGVALLLAVIAAGTGYLMVHARDEKDVAKWKEILRKDGRDFDEKLSEEHRNVELVRDACRPHLELLLPFLASPEPDLRAEVSNAFANYPESREVLLPALEAAFAKEEDEDVRPAMEESIAALGLTSVDLGRMQSRSGLHRNFIVRGDFAVHLWRRRHLLISE